MKIILLISLYNFALNVDNSISKRSYAAHMQSCNVVSTYDVKWKLTLKNEGQFVYIKSIIQNDKIKTHRIIGNWSQPNDSTLVLKDIFQLSKDNCTPDSIVYKIEGDRLLSKLSCFDYFKDGQYMVTLY